MRRSGSGIWWDRDKRRWRCRVYHRGRCIHTSYWHTIESARYASRTVRKRVDELNADPEGHTHRAGFSPMQSVAWLQRFYIPRPDDPEDDEAP